MERRSGRPRLAEALLDFSKHILNLVRRNVKVVAKHGGEPQRFFAKDAFVPFLPAGDETHNERHSATIDNLPALGNRRATAALMLEGESMSLIVISREMGSGGTQIGKAAAERLGYRFIDREVILEAARRYDLQEKELARMEESKPSFWERFNKDRERYLAFLRAALYGFAVQDNTVIAGRAAPLLLKEVAHALRVRITAPLAVRAARVAEEEGITQAQAEAKVKRYDAESAARLTWLFDTDCSSPLHYDVVLNTERGTLESLSQILVQTVRLSPFQPTPEALQALQRLNLEAQVRAALLLEPGLKMLDIRVRAEGGVVHLEAAAFGSYWTATATRAAQSVPGVETVHCQTIADTMLYAPPHGG